MISITSPAFGENQMIPAKYTCDGENVSPPLAVSEIPPGTGSMALIVDDPDAPGGIWTHWLVWNIPPETTQVKEGEVPKYAMEGTTSRGKPGYGGPCPPQGIHRYRFNIYALDQKLELSPLTRQAELEKAMQDKILGKATLTGLYTRK